MNPAEQIEHLKEQFNGTGHPNLLMGTTKDGKPYTLLCLDELAGLRAIMNLNSFALKAKGMGLVFDSIIHDEQTLAVDDSNLGPMSWDNRRGNLAVVLFKPKEKQ